MNDSSQYFLRRLTVTQGVHVYPQADLAEKLRAKVKALPGAESIMPMIGFTYEHSGIQQRGFEIDITESATRKDWYRTVNEANLSMSVRIIKQLFNDDLKASDCDGLIVVSSTYAGFPGLSRQLQERSGFPLTAICYDLAGHGCAGAPHAIYLAHTLLESGRCRNICIVCVDAMGTHTQSRQHTTVPAMPNIVANCLAADGGAGLVLSKDAGTAPIFGYQSCQLTTKLWTDSLGYNTLSVCANNQPEISVGKEIRTRLVDEFASVAEPGLLDEPIYFHPGGIALMKLVGERYPQLRDTVALSAADLANEGNIGAPSVLSVFSRVLRERLPITPRFRLAAFGPGKVSAIVKVDGVEPLAGIN